MIRSNAGRLRVAEESAGAAPGIILVPILLEPGWQDWVSQADHATEGQQAKPTGHERLSSWR